MNNNYNNRRQNGQRPQGQLPQTNQQPCRQTRQPNGQYQFQQAPMPNNPYPPVRHKSRRQAQRAAGLVALTAVILVMLLISVIIFAARCASGSIGGDTDSQSAGINGDIGASGTDTADSGNDTTSPSMSDTTVPVETDPPVTELDAKYEYAVKTEADIHKGYLILVNYQNEYTFDGGFTIKPFYGNKNTSYKVRDTLVSFDTYAMSQCNDMMAAMEKDMGTGDVLVNSSFRTFEEQEDVYALYLDKYGEEYAQLYVAVPGYSEHHTGLAVDFTIYTDDGAAYTFDEKPEYPEWLIANGHKYGFIQRYREDKTGITKIAYENWHYRYVGKPHAYYMVANNLCLEEYIDLLRGFEYGKKHLAITDDEGASWEIYFVPADPSGTTQVPVPKYVEYEVSGNNVDGFIVTCRM